MKKIWIVAVAGIVACTGCTTASLEQYTLSQNRASGEGRDKSVLSCLATVADDPNVLPPYALYSAGVTSVTDSATLGLVTTWAPLKYTMEALGVTASTAPKGQWTVDPLVEYERLEAVYAACLWALFGPELGDAAYPGILGDPNDYLDGKPHFGVKKRLEKIPLCWVHRGRPRDVPLHARFKGHKGDTWVWVMPEDSEAFAQFTLALQDIATLDPTIISSPPIIVQLTTYEVTKLTDLTSETGKPKNVTISTAEPLRMVKKEYKSVVEKAIEDGIKHGRVNLTRAQWLAYTEPWFGVRTTPAGTPSASRPSGAPTGMQFITPSSTGPNRLPSPPPPLNFKLLE